MSTDQLIRRRLERASLGVPVDEEARLGSIKRGATPGRRRDRIAAVVVAAVFAAVGLAFAWQLLPTAERAGTAPTGPRGTVALFASDGGFQDFAALGLALPDGEPRPLIDEPNAVFPQWSPDGSALAYGVLEGDYLRLVVDVGGRRTVLLREGVHDFTWAPDGSSLLAVVAADAVGEEGGERVVLVGLDASVGELPIEPGSWQSVSASPDGSRLVLTGNGGTSERGEQVRQGVYVVNVDGTGMREIFSEPETYAFWTRWSPDGSRIVFVRGPSFDDFDPASDVYSIRPDGSELTRLTDHPGFDGWPVWSPDGRWILFSSDRGASEEQQVRNRRDPNGFGGAGAFVMPADGGPIEAVLLPVDDRQLVFTSGWRVDASGS
jgi:Tol biopolymer transport system component